MGPSTVQFWVLISLLKWQASNLNKIIFSTTNLGQRLFFFFITVVLCLMTENKYAAFSFISIYFFLTSFVFFFLYLYEVETKRDKKLFFVFVPFIHGSLNKSLFSLLLTLAQISQRVHRVSDFFIWNYSLQRNIYVWGYIACFCAVLKFLFFLWKLAILCLFDQKQPKITAKTET